MEYFYRSRELWDLLTAIQNEMVSDNCDQITQLVNDTVTSVITRIKCEISYQGFRGLLVSDREIADSLKEAEE